MRVVVLLILLHAVNGWNHVHAAVVCGNRASRRRAEEVDDKKKREYVSYLFGKQCPIQPSPYAPPEPKAMTTSKDMWIEYLHNEFQVPLWFYIVYSILSFMFVKSLYK